MNAKPSRSVVVHFTKDGAALIECRRENGTIEELRVIGADEKPSGHEEANRALDSEWRSANNE